MKEDRKIMRKFLKSIDEASLRKICEMTMLTEKETDILVCSFSRRQDANFVADKHNISLSTLRRETLQAVQKVKTRFGISRPDTVDGLSLHVSDKLRA